MGRKLWLRSALFVSACCAVSVACGSSSTDKVTGSGGTGAGGTASGGASGGAGRGGSSARGGSAGSNASSGAAGEAGRGEIGVAGQGGAAGEIGNGSGGEAEGGEGGAAPTAHVFSTITALYDAIDGGTLAEGDDWTVAWAADPRVTSAGSITGAVVQHLPSPSVFDHGALPLKLFAAKDWTTVGPANGLSFDASGYPVLQAANDSGDVVQVRTKLNYARYAFGRFTEVRLRASQDLTGAAVYSSVAFTLWDENDMNGLVGNHFVEVGGGSMSVAMDYWSAGVQTLSLGSPASTARVFDGFWSLTPNIPFTSTLTVNHAQYGLDESFKGQQSEVINGQGDWSNDTGLEYSAGFRLFAFNGGTGTSSAVGITLAITRYEP